VATLCPLNPCKLQRSRASEGNDRVIMDNFCRSRILILVANASKGDLQEANQPETSRWACRGWRLNINYVQQPIHKRLYHTIRTTVGFLTCCVSPTRAGDLAAGRKSDGNLATKDAIVCTKRSELRPELLHCDPKCLQGVKLMLEAKLTLCCSCSSIWVSTIELEMDSGTHTQHLLGLKGEFVVLTSCLG